MNLPTAIAMSVGNKASTYTDSGQTIVVQQRYTETRSWLHVWILGRAGVVEEGVFTRDWDAFHAQYKADPRENYWQSI